MMGHQHWVNCKTLNAKQPQSHGSRHALALIVLATEGCQRKVIALNIAKPMGSSVSEATASAYPWGLWRR